MNHVVPCCAIIRHFSVCLPRNCRRQLQQNSFCGLCISTRETASAWWHPEALEVLCFVMPSGSLVLKCPARWIFWREITCTNYFTARCALQVFDHALQCKRNDALCHWFRTCRVEHKDQRQITGLVNPELCSWAVQWSNMIRLTWQAPCLWFSWCFMMIYDLYVVALLSKGFPWLSHFRGQSAHMAYSTSSRFQRERLLSNYAQFLGQLVPCCGQHGPTLWIQSRSMQDGSLFK